MIIPMSVPGELRKEASSGLSYRLLTPAPAQPTSLVVLLHGVGGDETNLADLAAGVEPGALVALVRGRLALDPGRFAWFRVIFTESGPRIAADEAEDSRRALIRLIDRLQSEHGIEPGRTVLAGFSQGGILTASVALSAPERVAGFAILSGRILPELDSRIARREWMSHLKAFVGHGERDRVLPVAWAEAAHRRLEDLGIPNVLRRYPTEHTLGGAMRADVLAWIGSLTGAA